MLTSEVWPVSLAAAFARATYMYDHHTVSLRSRCLLVSLLLTVSGCSSAPTAITFSEPAELTNDGLRLLDATVMNKIWAREDLDLRRYRRFMTIDGGFHYKPGRVDYILSNTGQATFVVEVIDSTTGDVLIRAFDTRAAGSPGTSELSNRATNASNARRLAARWANLIANDLNTITTLPVLRD